MDNLGGVVEFFDSSKLTVGELVLAGLVLVAAIILARIARRATRGVLKSRAAVEPHVAELVGRIVGWTIIIGGIVTSLMIIGIEMGPVVVLLLIIVGLIAISGRQVLENFAAGLSLQVGSPFVVGDRIETAGVIGWVEAITSRDVVVTSLDRRTVHIPNSVVLDSVLFNHTVSDHRRTAIPFSVSYGSKIALAKEITLTAVAALEIVHDQPEPVVRIKGLGQYGVDLELQFYHADTDRNSARDQAAEAILNRLGEAGIAIPIPRVTIDQGDES